MHSSKQDWILLIHQLPPKPSNLRVRIWRKLLKLGAIAIKNSVYVLPANEKTHEDFQWLKQEIESAGGEASVFHAGSVEGATDKEIIDTFRKARDEDYAEITASLDGLAGAIREQTRGKHLSAGRMAAHETELDRLHAELERVIANDFFGAPGRVDAMNAYKRCQKALRASQSPRKNKLQKAADKRGILSASKYQSRRWMTRRNIHIDRLASAWLIKQFIDKRPRFYFVSEGESIDGAIAFDMFGAEFTHQGEDCTFETILRRFGLNNNQSLRQIGEIVHDIDLKDDKFQRLEAAGLNATINALSKVLRDDRKLLQQCTLIFDGLYTVLGRDRNQEAANRKVSTRKRRRK